MIVPEFRKSFATPFPMVPKPIKPTFTESFFIKKPRNTVLKPQKHNITDEKKHKYNNNNKITEKTNKFPFFPFIKGLLIILLRL
jgi:hypothetical protein